jgi:O-antigen/teichoic acid export membrane protein
VSQDLRVYIHANPYLLFFILASYFFSAVAIFTGYLKSTAMAPSANFLETGVIPLIFLSVLFGLKVDDLINAAMLYFFILCGLSVVLIATLIIPNLKWADSQQIFSIQKNDILEAGKIMQAAVLEFTSAWIAALVLILYSDAIQLAEFHIAARVTILVSLILIVVNSVTAPAYAKYFRENDVDGVRRLSETAASLLFLLCLGPVFLFLFFPGQILSIFGKGYVSAADILVILLVGHLVNIMSGSVGYILMMSGNSDMYKSNTFLGAVTVTVVAFCLIPIYGGVGAAVATSCGMCVKNIRGVYKVYQLHGFISLPNIKNILKIITLRETYEIFRFRD